MSHRWEDTFNLSVKYRFASVYDSALYYSKDKNKHLCIKIHTKHNFDTDHISFKM